MKKNILYILLTTALTAISLVGCSSSSEEKVVEDATIEEVTEEVAVEEDDPFAPKDWLDVNGNIIGTISYVTDDDTRTYTVDYQNLNGTTLELHGYDEYNNLMGKYFYNNYGTLTKSEVYETHLNVMLYSKLFNNNGIETIITSYEYDNMGLLLHSYENIASNGKLLSITDYEYDENDNLKSKTYTPKEIEYQPPASTFNYVYNDKNLLMEETSMSEGEINESYKYFYDDNDNLKKKIRLDTVSYEYTVTDYNNNGLSETVTGYSDMTGSILYRTTFDEYEMPLETIIYDEDGLEISKQTRTYNELHLLEEQCIYDEYGSLSDKLRCKYDEYGNLIREITYDPYNDLISLSYQYTYDEYGNRLTQTWYDENDTIQSIETVEYNEYGDTTIFKNEYTREDGNITDVLIYTYDENNNITSFEDYDENDNIEYNTIYDYDENGLCTSLITYDSYGDIITWEDTKYNDDALITRVNRFGADGTPMSWNVASYNEDNKIESYELYTLPDASSDTGTLAYYTEYIYNENGNLIYENQPSIDGNFAYQNNYTYDDKYNLTYVEKFRKLLETDEELSLSLLISRIFDDNNRMIESYLESDDGFEQEIITYGPEYRTKYIIDSSDSDSTTHTVKEFSYDQATNKVTEINTTNDITNTYIY